MILSSYTTVYNCIKNKYPWEEAIKCLLGFSDEVCVIDGGSQDGTWERLKKLSEENESLKIKQCIIDWNRPDFAYESDGRQKARARKMCTGDVCWQSDIDELVVEDDYEKIKVICKAFYETKLDLLALPLVEYWGDKGKVRVDINPWKWRISKNKDYITHGIPDTHLRVSESGYEYSLKGSDSCDYINSTTKQRIPFGIIFDIENLNYIRNYALAGNEEMLNLYQKKIEDLIKNIPTIRHYSWYNIENKIHNYKNHWSKFWCSLYNNSLEDTSENNMMFDKPWLCVSDQEIKDLSKKLEENFGGWIFHEKINWDKKVPWINKTWE